MGALQSKEAQTQNELRELQTSLSPYCEMEPLRIVLCGLVKVGKSSLINTILSAFEGKLIQIANVGDVDDHATAKYTEYKIRIPDKSKKVDKTCVVVCDTRGIDKASPKEQEEALKAALTGSYASNQYMDNTSNDEVRQMRKKRKAVYVIIVIDSTDLKEANMSQETPTLMKTILTFANREAIPLSIFLTKCDKLDGEVAKNIEHMGKSEKVEFAINYVTQKTGTPKIRIFPVVNYTDQPEATPPMRLQILNAFKHIISDVEKYMSLVVRDCE